MGCLPSVLMKNKGAARGPSPPLIHSLRSAGATGRAWEVRQVTTDNRATLEVAHSDETKLCLHLSTPQARIWVCLLHLIPTA